jgi:DNA-directed RNA polymerase specialized sigma54-like protein
MVLLQHRLSVKLSQRQILTPGLVQMVSVLALNKLELKDMINAEMVENPVLEELEESAKKKRIASVLLPRATTKIPSPPPRRKIPSKRSTSVRSSRIISIPGTAPTARWRISSAHRSRISSPNRRT